MTKKIHQPRNWSKRRICTFDVILFHFLPFGFRKGRFIRRPIRETESGKRAYHESSITIRLFGFMPMSIIIISTGAARILFPTQADPGAIPIISATLLITALKPRLYEVRWISDCPWVRTVLSALLPDSPETWKNST